MNPNFRDQLERFEKPGLVESKRVKPEHWTLARRSNPWKKVGARPTAFGSDRQGSGRDD